MKLQRFPEGKELGSIGCLLGGWSYITFLDSQSENFASGNQDFSMNEALVLLWAVSYFGSQGALSYDKKWLEMKTCKDL